jgi:hypothetical protein
MAIARCIETRIMEAVWKILHEDADLIAHCNASATRIQLGPMQGEVNVLSAPQINVVPDRAGLTRPGAGVTGATTRQVRIAVLYFAQDMGDTLPTSGVGRINAWDVSKHICLLISRGKFGLLSTNKNVGWLTDPDDATVTLTNGLIDLRIAAGGVSIGDNLVSPWAIGATFETRENARTGVRE